GLHHRQRDADDGAVDERDARAQDRCREHPRTCGRRRAAALSSRGPDDAFVARRTDEARYRGHRESGRYNARYEAQAKRRAARAESTFHATPRAAAARRPAEGPFAPPRHTHVQCVPGGDVSEAPVVVALDGVSKSFDGGATFAVRGVTLAVRRGELVAIIGPSGSGKTTALKTINRLIDVDEGRVAVAGEPVDALPPHALRRRIGYVFQGIGLFPHFTVAENISVTPGLLGWPRPRIAAR